MKSPWASAQAETRLSRYATGHETSPFLPLTQFWAVGDSTSGTRVYSSKSLAGLVARLASREAEYVPTLPNLQGC